MGFRVGVFFPHTEIEADAGAIRAFVHAIEDMGYDHLATADHVVGVNRESRPGWEGPYDSTSRFYEPLTFFSFLSGFTTRLGFLSAILVAPQRQTVLIAKQAANLDMFCGGRLRIGVGTGWNPVEYEALGEDWARRGERLDSQIRLLRKLWTEPHVTEHSDQHSISDAGICPLPTQQPIPVWVGGVAPPAMRRAAKLGDGWLPYLTTEGADEKLAAFRDMVVAAGRRADDVPVENVVHMGTSIGGPERNPEDIVADAEIWRKAGAASICISTMNRGLRGADEHLEAFRKIADMLELGTD
ncbi:MAG TPA: LLM class F420-dependent oxidoreductase [Steroidobacter sp.]|uniref:LLM class F420-dependent oxidoreductase n=1 Tax=Steroidobacter sp. TaxID=1978227 RepID=UPI002ED9FC0E